MYIMSAEDKGEPESQVGAMCDGTLLLCAQKPDEAFVEAP